MFTLHTTCSSTMIITLCDRIAQRSVSVAAKNWRACAANRTMFATRASTFALSTVALLLLSAAAPTHVAPAPAPAAATGCGGTGGAALEVLNPVAAAYTSPRGAAAAPPQPVHVHLHVPAAEPMMTPVRTAEPPPLAVGSAGIDAATQSPVDPSPSPSASPAVWPEAAAWREAAAAAGCAPAATPVSPPLLPSAEAASSLDSTKSGASG